ncbi:glycogen debranching protein GlgX [Georgenia sp. MJ170]|uniref:glycogen debranching protein GlgX n=1 Tax=Georgenia sunbinii TaxID=3117728 RepID=UPI002F260E48
MTTTRPDTPPPAGTDPVPGPLAAPAEPLTTRPVRLGAHLTATGVDVAVIAGHAEAVDLCLLDLDRAGELTERRFRLHRGPRGVWQGHVPGVRAGQRYGLRAHGRWDPDGGLRHNPAKLLLDPYARAVVGEFELVPAVFGQQVSAGFEPLDGRPRSDADSAPHVRHGVVVEEPPTVPVSDRPHVPWDRTVVYEAHVRGLTMRLPGVPEHLRGTYAGLAHPVTVAHLRSLGVTTVELLPIHARNDEPFLVAQGRTNYWGYNTLSFFAPEPTYATEEAQARGPAAVLDEVRGMVSILHDAGLEVLLDVVYNHSAEGGADGPVLGLRGLDSAGYYLHDGMHPARLVDVTGCGNSLDFRRTQVVALTLDSLRYWVQQIGVDGFRFDLATTMGRNAAEFTPDHPFFVAMDTDPVLSTTKRIAEPWDLGPAGWRTGQFPAPMAEWNDRFRDAARTFWLADPATGVSGGTGQDLRDLATRLAGSADLFAVGGPPGHRAPSASINYVTAHDGFTMADLVSYNDKHNEANGEDNRDGTNDNRSWNHGVEGPVAARGAGSGEAEHPLAHDIVRARRRSIRNLMGTMLLSAGTPMITAGDELGRTQHGNNNAYCQDNEISWVDWDLADWQHDLLQTTRYLLRLRREHPVLRPDFFASGQHREDDALPDLAWFTADARPMDSERWHDPHTRVLQMVRSGHSHGADLVLVVNGSLTEQVVTLPEGRGDDYVLMWDSGWERQPTIDNGTLPAAVRPGATATLEPLSLQVFLTRR